MYTKALVLKIKGASGFKVPFSQGIECTPSGHQQLTAWDDATSQHTKQKKLDLRAQQIECTRGMELCLTPLSFPTLASGQVISSLWICSAQAR